MNSEQFIQDAIRTESRPDSQLFTNAGLSGVFKLLIEAGKVADVCKRGIFYGKGLDTEKLGVTLESLGTFASHVQYDLDNNLLIDDGNDEKVSYLHKPNLRLVHVALGILSESGEMLEALLKQMETGSLDKVNFGEELADVDWYKAVGHDETGVSEPQQRTALIAKLKERYGDKFTSDAAHNRNLEAERAILEENLASDDTKGEDQ